MWWYREDGGGGRNSRFGKTSVLMHTVRDLKHAGIKTALVKIDCLWTEDDARFKRLDVPVAIGLSKDMCPDHYAIYNVDEMLEWAKKQDADVLLKKRQVFAYAVRLIPTPAWPSVLLTLPLVPIRHSKLDRCSLQQTWWSPPRETWSPRQRGRFSGSASWRQIQKRESLKPTAFPEKVHQRWLMPSGTGRRSPAR